MFKALLFNNAVFSWSIVNAFTGGYYIKLKDY